MGRRRHANAIERAEEDIARGDMGLARQRLNSYLRHRGYDPELLARMGRLCHDMHDLHQAGRYWMLSTDDSPEARAAIAEFVRRSASNPRHVVGQLPHASYLSDLQKYPPIVVERLKQYGLDVVWPQRTRRAARSSSVAGQFIATLGCLTIVVVGIVIFTAGCLQVWEWIFG